MIDLELQGEIKRESRILPHFELVRTITCHPFKLESPNLNKKCILVQLRCLFLLICAVFVSHLVRALVNLSETIAGYRSNRSALLIMLTEPTFCRNSSIKISIDNRYDNRLIHLGRPILTVNHNGACVYTTDYTSDRACACYTREAPLTQSANWVSDHRYSTAWFFYCSVNPLLLQ